MNAYVYNLSLIGGMVMVAGGVGLLSVAGGLIAGGVLLIGLTIFNMVFVTRTRSS